MNHIADILRIIQKLVNSDLAGNLVVASYSIGAGAIGFLISSYLGRKKDLVILKRQKMEEIAIQLQKAMYHCSLMLSQYSQENNDIIAGVTAVNNAEQMQLCLSIAYIVERLYFPNIFKKESEQILRAQRIIGLICSDGSRGFDRKKLGNLATAMHLYNCKIWDMMEKSLR